MRSVRSGGKGPQNGPNEDPNDGPKSPLAARLRPSQIAGFVGQQQLLAPGSALATALELGRPHSMILYGPPGSGKTTLARILAQRAASAYEELSAVAAGRPEIRAVLERAQHRRATSGQATVLFLDEIHRFNKVQQDALLPAVEDGLLTLIGATTENPAFEVIGALLSRVRVYALEALAPADIETILRRGAEELGADAAPEAIEFLASHSEGDARTALNALELAAQTAARNGDGHVDMERAQDALQRRAVLYDKQGDRHYDYISAWIKATRASDPDASLYYLAVMLEGGEDPRFIARRMVILASEDIGNADPAALPLATAAAAAVERVGLPEARYALAQAAIYLSLAPKSNAAGRALGAAQRHVREHGALPIRASLRIGPRPGVEAAEYDNPHSHPGHIGPQPVAPEALGGERFYAPDDAEAALAERLAAIRAARASTDTGTLAEQGQAGTDSSTSEQR